MLRTSENLTWIQRVHFYFESGMAMATDKKRVLILVNKQTTVVNFRLEVVAGLVHAGYHVIVSVPEGDRLAEIEAVGATVIPIKMEKDSTDPVKDIALMFHYRKLIKETGADVVLTYTIKPNVYGGMAAASLHVPYVANITGLGTALVGKGILQKIALVLYKIGFAKISKVFFQNAENMAFFEEKRIATGKYELLPGSGVNLSKFSVLDYPPDDVVEFAFISRIRKEKGIDQYIDAARAIRTRYPNTRFHVCGFGEAYYESLMRQLHDEGVIVYHGLLNDVRVMLKDVHCVVHPTYYPEGMSNVLLEGASSGRPIISTDHPGCREAIEDGANGFIVQKCDSQDLIAKIEQFLNLTYEQKREMGLKGREKVEKEFDRNIVVERYLQTVAELVNK